MPEESRSILFVCMGNICRSPAAHGLFCDYVEKHQHSIGGEIRVDSAGTHGYHVGEAADQRMRQAAAKRGHVLESRARRVTVDDLADFDLILAMDRDNLALVQSLEDETDSGTTAVVTLFSDFLDDGWPTDVPDPYYGGSDGFEYVLDMIQAGCPNILYRLLKMDGNTD